MPNYFKLTMFTAILLLAAACSQDKGGSSGIPESSELVTNEAETYAPVTIENMNRTVTFTEPPRRAVGLLQQYTEMLVALGLEDRVVGNALISEGTPPELKEKLDNIPVLAERTPSQEVLLGADPDFVIGSAVSFTEGSVGTADKLESLGIKTYVPGEVYPTTMEIVYNDIMNIARIFGVTSKGDELVASMQQHIRDIQERIKDVERPLRVFYTTGDQDGAARTTGGDSIRSHLITLAGGENIFSDLTGGVVEVSWEEVVDRNPDVIVLAHRGENTPEGMLEFFYNKPVLQDIKAVQNQHFVAVPLASTTVGVRNPGAVEMMAKGFYPDRFE